MWCSRPGPQKPIRQHNKKTNGNPNKRPINKTIPSINLQSLTEASLPKHPSPYFVILYPSHADLPQIWFVVLLVNVWLDEDEECLIILTPLVWDGSLLKVSSLSTESNTLSPTKLGLSSYLLFNYFFNFNSLQLEILA